MTQFWFILSIFFIILELINPGLFFFLALSLGATVTMLTQLYNVSWISEYAIFFASTTVMFALLQITIKRMQKKKTLSYVSSMQDLTGTITEITEVTSPSTGYVNLDGVDWAIKVQSDAAISVGMKVKVTGIKGCHLQVTPINKN